MSFNSDDDDEVDELLSLFHITKQSSIPINLLYTYRNNHVYQIPWMELVAEMSSMPG